MASFGGTLALSPVGIQGYYAVILKDGPPHWLLVTMLIMIVAGVVLLALGNAIVGVAGKGQDTHSTEQQIEAATFQATANQAVVDASAVATPSQPSKVIAEPETAVKGK